MPRSRRANERDGRLEIRDWHLQSLISNLQSLRRRSRSMHNGAIEPYIWDAVEALPRPELERLQVERLRACVVRVAETVPFYRKKLALAGVTADSIRTLDDLARLPLTTKQDLRDHYPFGLLAVPLEQVLRVHASSG